MPTVIDTAALPDPRGIRDACDIGNDGVRLLIPPRIELRRANPSPPPTSTHAANMGLEFRSELAVLNPAEQPPLTGAVVMMAVHRMALHALALAFEAGMPGWCPIFLSVDEDLSIADWNNTAVHFFRGAGDAIGTQWVGVGGSSKVCAWAVERPRRRAPHHPWQTVVVVHARLVRQRDRPGRCAVPADHRHPVQSRPGRRRRPCRRQRRPRPRLGAMVHRPQPRISGRTPGGTVVRNTKPPCSATPHPAVTETRVSNGFWHTEEGNGTVRSLAGYLNNTANGVSYHDLVRDRIVGHVVNDDHASWSVLDANPFSYNLCFAGSRAAWSRERVDGTRRRHPHRRAPHPRSSQAERVRLSIIADPYRRADGIADHNYVTRILGIGNHTDACPNFP